MTTNRAVSVRDAIEAGVDLDDVLVVLGKLKDPDVNRRLRLFAADCAARVLSIYERLYDDPSPRNAIIVARRFARGEATDEERAAAEAAAWAAARDAEAARAARAARAAEAAWAGAWAGAWTAAEDARSAAGAAGDAETAWQRVRLIERFEGEPKDWPLEDVK